MSTVLLFLLVVGVISCHGDSITFQLLVVLNVQGGPGVPNWDRGLEILPAAQQAADRVNGNPSILHGHHLELIQVDTGTCIPNFDSKALINFVQQITLKDRNIVGVVGLFCSSVAQLILPLVGHRGFSLLQISGSASPVLHNQEKYPYLWHMVPSSAAYIEAVYKMMDAFGWTNIAVIGGTDASYYHTASAFTTQARSQVGNTSTFVNTTLLVADGMTSSVLKNLQQSRKRIVFASVGAREAAEIICLAYQEGFIWPNYAWIFSDHQLEDLVRYNVCDSEILRSALEGAYFLRFRFNSSGPDTQTNTPNPYADVMHDSIQAFALALNGTLGHLQVMNLTLEDSHLGNSDLADMLQSELMMMSFTGALGRVEFDSKREWQTRVDIFQVQNGSAIHVGSYGSVSTAIILENVNRITDALSNEIPRIYKHSPLIIIVLLLTVTGVCITVTTIILVLFIYYRRAAEIKATSPNLSLLMFLGCYLLFVSTLFHTISDAVVNHGPFFCSSVIWCAGIGINLIFGVLLVRMLRVYRIFTFFGKMGKEWSDVGLCIVVFLIVGAEALFFLVWSVVDVTTVRDVETFQATASPPYYEVVQFCYSEHLQIWLVVSLAEVGLLIFVVAFLAFKTRKIRRKHFKDTKKVNMYLFMNILLICVLVPFWWVLRTANDPASTVAILYLGYGGTATLCQLLLFVPKVLPPLMRHMFHKVPEERLRSRAMIRQATHSFITESAFTQSTLIKLQAHAHTFRS